MFKTVCLSTIAVWFAASINLSAQPDTCEFHIKNLGIPDGYVQVSGDGQVVMSYNYDRNELMRQEVGTGATAFFNFFIRSTYSVSEDGNRIAYNGFTSLELFDVTTGETFRFPTPQVESITLSGNGQRIAFRSTHDFGSNPEGSDEWFLLDVPSGVITQLTDTPPAPVNISNLPGAISYDGRTVCFNSDFGSPVPILGLWQEGVGLRNLDRTNAGYFGVSVDRAGTFISFRSTSDITGGNPNRYEQVFGYDILSNKFIQLTHGTSFTIDWNDYPALSADGQTIFHASAANYTGQHPNPTLYRIDRQGTICPIAEIGDFQTRVFSEFSGRHVLYFNSGLLMAIQGPTVPTLSNTALIGFIILIAILALTIGRRLRLHHHSGPSSTP